MKQRKSFSEDEIKKLKKLFPNEKISVFVLLREFPDRCYATLHTKAKILNCLNDKRRIVSEEARENMRNSHPSWCKGLTKETDERIANYAKKISKSRKGMKFSDDHIKHLRESHLNPSEEIRANIRKHRAKQIFPYRDSMIEKYIQNFLDELGIEYQTHQIIDGLLDPPYEYHRFDIVIPSHRVLLEANGCYWHGCSRCFQKLNSDQEKWRNRDLDIRDMVSKSDDWNLFEIWECDIKEMIKLKGNSIK